MYKKIKNSSFMNWLWFIIYLLPLIMIIVFSINFYRFDDLNINENPITEHIENKLLVPDYFTFNDYSSVIYNEDLNYFSFTDSNSDGLDINYFMLRNFVDNGFKYLTFIVYNFDFGNSCFVISDGSILYQWYCSGIDTLVLDNFPNNSIISYPMEVDENSFLYVLLTDKPFEAKFFYDNYYNSSTPVNNREFDLILSGTPTYDYATYLQDNFYNTFSHTGIIYNMFINLFNYFGVFNIYIQIISVYLEYIILISLIHLAVDILLLLPNICHKFMEKVGGERD